MRSDEHVHDAPQEDEASPEIVLLDRLGLVVAANQAWLDLSRAIAAASAAAAVAATPAPGPGPVATGAIEIGAPFLALCSAPAVTPHGTDRAGAELVTAVQDAVRGELTAPVRVRHAWPPAPAAHRFDVLVSSRFDGWGDCVGATITLSPGDDAGSAASDEPFRSAFELAPIGIAVVRLDEQGGRTVVRANAALAELFGAPLDRLTGTDLAEFSTPGNHDHDRRIVADLLSGARTSYARLKRYRRTDGQVIWVEVRVSRVDLPGQEGATALAHFVDVTERHEAARRRASRIRSVQQRLAVLEDRERIARDLHDTVIQDLIAIGMELARSGDPSLVGRLEDTVRRLRASVFELRHPELSGPLPDAVRAVATEASRVLGHRPLVRINGGADEVPPAVGDAVVAVLREGLSNVARHAHARSTDVDLTVEARQVKLVVSDDGRGLPPVLVAGDGIANVRQRAVDLRGDAIVEARPDGGTRLVWSCPLPGEEPRVRPGPPGDR